ncbi:MAG: choice-of-anchor Q domain-containing protein [Rudaea sp.]
MNMRTLALAGLLAALPLSNALATTWTVTGSGEAASLGSNLCNSSNQCLTLRDAINSATSGDTIQFSNAIDGSTIVLSLFSDALGTSSRTSSEFGPSAFFLTGGMSLTIDGRTGLTRGITIARDTTKVPFRLFDIDNGSGLTLQGLTLENGLAHGGQSEVGGGSLGAGGAIFNQGSVTISQCTFTGNRAQGGTSLLQGSGLGGGGVGADSANYDGGGPNGGISGGNVNGGFGGGGAGNAGTGGAGGFGGGGGSSSGDGGNGGFGGGGGLGNSGTQGQGGVGGGNAAIGASGTPSSGGGGAGMGGAIFNDAGILTITNSTFTSNTAAGGGSGMGGSGSGFGGAIFNYSGSLTIVNSTLALNTAIVGPCGYGCVGGTVDGGAVYSLDDHGCNAGGNTCGNSASTFDLENSIFSNSQGGTHDIVINTGSPPAAGTFSGLIVMSYDSTQFTTNPVSSADPQLSPLGHYGGWTPTMVPHQGSAAIDAVGCVLAVDQRGVARPQGTSCDVGAVEYDGDYIFANGFDY